MFILRSSRSNIVLFHASYDLIDNKFKKKTKTPTNTTPKQFQNKMKVAKTDLTVSFFWPIKLYKPATLLKCLCQARKASDHVFTNKYHTKTVPKQILRFHFWANKTSLTPPLY